LRDAEGLTVDRRAIELSNPIRAVGSYPITIKIAPKLEPKITVNVVDEAESATPEAPAESVASAE